MTIAMMAAVMIGTPVVADATPLQPQGRWSIEYADSMCILSRRFGPVETGVTLALRPLPIGSSTEFVLITPDRANSTTRGRAGVTILPAGIRRESDAVAWRMKDGAHRIATVTLPDTQPELANATAIRLEIGNKPTVMVVPTGIARALTALKTCQDDLLRSWKIDPDAQNVEHAAVPAGRPTEEWLSSDDYPIGAVAAGIEGTSTILWIIGTDGQVNGCRAVGRSSSDDLDKAACMAITKRGRYVPAKDKDGKPVSSFAMRRITWRLP